MAKLRLLCCVLSVSSVASTATAGILTLSQTLFEETPVDAPEAEAPVLSEADAESEEEILALDQHEIQERFERGAGIGVGVIAPWQKLALHGLLRAGEATFWTTHLGGGTFEVTGERLSRTYELAIESYSLTMGHRWMVSRLMPFFIEPMLGYGAWRGRIKPKGSDPATDTVAATLDSSFSASGLTAGAQFGVFWMWESGFFLEYSIFRIGRGLALAQAYSSSGGEARDVVRENLESWYSWGYANLTLGWSF